MRISGPLPTYTVGGYLGKVSELILIAPLILLSFHLQI